jgi:hypothetical protein
MTSSEVRPARKPAVLAAQGMDTTVILARRIQADGRHPQISMSSSIQRVKNDPGGEGDRL